MELNIIEDKKNPLLERRDVFGTVKYSGATPKKEEIENFLAAKLKTKTTRIDLIYVRSLFGKMEAEFKAKIYDKDIKEAPKVDAEEKKEEGEQQEGEQKAEAGNQEENKEQGQESE